MWSATLCRREFQINAITEDRAPLLTLADDAEAEIVAGVVRHVRAARGGAQTVEARLPTSAAIHAGFPGSSSARIHARCTAIGFEVIEAPLPDVPRHVEKAEWAGAIWKGAD